MRNFKRLIINILLIATGCGIALAQQSKIEVRPVDFDHIRQVTMSAKNEYYFPKLLKMFTGNDTTKFKLEHARNLYYGYTFQEDYDPLRESVYSSRVEDLYYQDKHTRVELDSIEHYADLSLADNIFDLNQMTYQIFALHEKKKFQKETIRKFRLDRIIAAIMSSGRGTKDAPWVVISPDHEYNIVNFLGYRAIGHETSDDGIDRITVEPRPGKTATEFYFDLRRALQVAAVKYPD